MNNMERRPRGIIINPNADEGTTPAPTLYDASGRPMSRDVGKPIIHAPAQHRLGEADALVPGLAEARRKFVEAGIELSEGKSGGLTLATKKPRKLELVGADTAPEELRGSEPIIAEYFDFPPELIACVLEAHKSGKINLYSGDIKQFAVYTMRIIQACGFTAESDAYRLIQSCLGNSAGGARSLKDLVSRRLPQHPRVNDVEKTEGGYTWKTKAYEEDCVPYDNLALALLPEIWNSMDSTQKGQLIKSLLLLHETTTNFKEIDAARLHERLAEICTNEKEMSLRYNIYAILDAVPSESLTAIAKNNLAGAMIRYNDFGTDLAFSLLRESEEMTAKKPSADIGAGGLEKLWPMYKKYEQGVLDKLAQPLVDLATTTDTEWVKLMDSVTRLSPYALIDSSEPKKDDGPIGHFGLELEFTPLERDPYITVEKFTEALKYSDNNNLLPLSTDVDQDCAEVRTDVGGERFDAKTLHLLQDAIRSLQHAEPLGWWATMHVHIDEDTCRDKRIQNIYAELNTNTEHNTHEIRSFPSPNYYADGPTQGPELNRVSITRLAYLVKCGLTSRDIPDKNNVDNELLANINSESLSANARLRKLLAISLCGNDPRQRAATLYTVHTSPMFLHPTHILDVVTAARSSNKTELLKAGLEIVSKDQINGYILAASAYRNNIYLPELQELYSITKDTVVKNSIFEGIGSHGKKTGIPFLLEHFREIADEDVKLSVLPTILIYDKEAGLVLLQKEFYDEKNIGIRSSIIEYVAIYGGDAGVTLLQEWYPTNTTPIRAANDNLIRGRIIRLLARHGGKTALPFLMKHYSEINDNNLKVAVLLIVAVRDGSDGIPFIEQHYHEIEDDRVKEQILEVVLNNGGDAGTEAVRRWYDKEDDYETRTHILEMVMDIKGAHAVSKFTGGDAWLQWQLPSSL